MTARIYLLASAAILAPQPLFAQASEPAAAVQPAPDAAEDQDSEEDTIVVTGQRPRGSVVGDIPPEKVLDRRDIRATGATSIAELLDAVSAQTGSARGRSGGRPILLLNGQRISGFRELRDLPPEAIERMEILPEEVALKYGFAADSRVVNIVLRRRFDSTSVEARARTATEGGFSGGQAESTRLLIRDGQRTSLNLRLEGNGALTEAERDIALATPLTPDPREARTLLGSARSARATATVNRTVFGDVAATLTGEVGRSLGQSRFGLDSIDFEPLGRRVTTDSASLGSVLNAQRGSWRLSSTGNADLSRTTTRSDRDLALEDDQSRSNRRSLSLDATATGPLLSLPAGEANATLKIGAGRTDLDSRAQRGGIFSDTDLGRTSGEASASVDLPVLKRAWALGRLTANANAGLVRLSDFGTLTSLGGGLNWTPAPRLSLIASFTREEGPPSLHQLGDPVLETPRGRFFDAVRGTSVEVTTLTGGNPDLKADRRRVVKLGGNWQPVEKFDLRLRADYVRSAIDRPQASFPAASAALEAAFPDRFTRDSSGALVRVDLRPVNFLSSRRDTLRWGFDFTKPLKSTPPSPAAIAAFRQRFAQNRPAAPATGEGPPLGERRFGGGGGGGGARFGGGANGGRLTLSMTHTLNLTDRVTIAEGIDDLDYLDGEALGQSGGRARHEVKVEGGYFNNALGARISADWRSATQVDSGPTGSLRFSPFAKVDLRFFANLGERFDLVARHPWLRGTSVRFDVDNLFNRRPKVRDGAGATPFNYQPGLLDPTGRTVGITLRKLFVPIRFFRAGGGGRPGG
ncbi:MAG TPA: TonB-dependent receptor plug domain-containing protein [Sphingomicrobium sp.]|nr:TonB-dependent receptor plug domain-containing protein [Sphingomicrobium sp.]